MSITIPASIRPSIKFNGAYEVIHYAPIAPYSSHLDCYRKTVIPCANLATARTIKRDLNEGRAPAPVAVEPSPLTAEQLGGCLTGGCGYDPAVTWIVTGRVERVHNWATARNLKRNYPAQSEQVFASVLA